MTDVAERIAAQFAVAGAVVAVAPRTTGHINDSFVVTFAEGGAQVQMFLQRINTTVFERPEQMMDNVARVTAHLARFHRGPDASRRGLTLIPGRAGGPCVRDELGGWWRMYRFIADTQVFETVTSVAHAEQAAFAFGEFQRLLADLPAPRLHETLPDFHTTPLRYAALERAVVADPRGRRAGAAEEIAFALERRAEGDVLLRLRRDGVAPERVVHNDAKLSNVLFDAVSGAALCVTDLDTVMPGLALFDFGDMVRSMTCPCAEDAIELHDVTVQPELFAALARGYLAAVGTMLTTAEREHLVRAGHVITLEQGVRFLTDYLLGDGYYKTTRPEQNLERARTQFRLVASLEEQEGELGAIVRRC
jgi:Ser/Thr protein kinase RdoA (MazF antagonist)